MKRRHDRLTEAGRYKYRLQLLAERRRIAEIEGDAIKLLVADDALGEDFGRRLRVALDKAKREAPPELVAAQDPEIDGEEEAESEAAVAAHPEPRGRKAERRPSRASVRMKVDLPTCSREPGWCPDPDKCFRFGRCLAPTSLPVETP
jgi:hypothetical protein